MNIITLTANPAVDRTYYVASLTVGAINRAREVRSSIGAKGLNVSRIFRLCGVSAKALGFCGGANGEAIKAMLKAEDVPYDFVETAAESRINIKIVSADGPFTEVNENGIVTQDEKARLVESLQKEQQENPIDFLFLCGSVPQALGKDFYAEIVQLFAESNTKIVVDAEGALLQNALECRPGGVHLIKPNLYEFGLLTGSEYDLQGDYDAALARLSADAKAVSRKYGTEILLTMGEFGAMYIHGDEIARVGANKIEVKTFAGAGDTFLTAFLAAHLGLLPDRAAMQIPEALAFGAAATEARMVLLPYELPTFQDILEREY